MKAKQHISTGFLILDQKQMFFTHFKGVSNETLVLNKGLQLLQTELYRVGPQPSFHPRLACFLSENPNTRRKTLPGTGLTFLSSLCLSDGAEERKY